MQFKQKFAYMALGGGLVFLGNLLPSIIDHSATAQGENRSVTFDEIRCRSLKIVDASGKTYVVLEKKDIMQNVVYDAIQIFNGSGQTVCRLGGDPNGGSLAVNRSTGDEAVVIGIDSTQNKGGVVLVEGKDGKKNCSLLIGEFGGVVTVSGVADESFSQLSVDEAGGAVVVKGKDGKSSGQLSINKAGGLVFVTGKDGQSVSQLSFNEYGGAVIVKGKESQSRGQLSIDKYGGRVAISNNAGLICLQASVGNTGGGIVRTKNRFGYYTGGLP
ncbi:MAG: hypothetical protein O7E52_24460 [Candidatus Poribacteria bacterium]|nr:hypothetical protein [Candidatus Poribacteria bacterium]